MSTMPLDKEVAVSEHGAVYSVIFPCLCHTYVILAVEAPRSDSWVGAAAMEPCQVIRSKKRGLLEVVGFR